MPRGEVTIDFGSAPGLAEVTVTVTGQTAISSSTSQCDAWLAPKATADHTVEDHIWDGPIIFAHTIVDNVGFSITARIKDFQGDSLLIGTYNVGWVWV